MAKRPEKKVDRRLPGIPTNPHYPDVLAEAQDELLEMTKEHQAATEAYYLAQATYHSTRSRLIGLIARVDALKRSEKGGGER